MSDKKWVEEFYSEPIVKRIVDEVRNDNMEKNPSESDLVSQACDICEGLLVFANDYNCTDAKIQDMWGLLSKYGFRSGGDFGEEGSYSKEVYEFLQKVVAPELKTESWTKWVKGEVK